MFFHVACMSFIEYFQFLSKVWKTNINYEAQKIVIRTTGLSLLSTENSVNSGFLQAASCSGKNFFALLLWYLDTNCIILITTITLPPFRGQGKQSKAREFFFSTAKWYYPSEILIFFSSMADLPLYSLLPMVSPWTDSGWQTSWGWTPS